MGDLKGRGTSGMQCLCCFSVMHRYALLRPLLGQLCLDFLGHSLHCCCQQPCLWPLAPYSGIGLEWSGLEFPVPWGHFSRSFVLPGQGAGQDTRLDEVRTQASRQWGQQLWHRTVTYDGAALRDFRAPKLWPQQRIAMQPLDWEPFRKQRLVVHRGIGRLRELNSTKSQLTAQQTLESL